MALYSMGRRRVIALLVLTSILLITLDQRGNAVIDRTRSVFSLILEPFDAASRAVSRPIINAWRGITEYDELVQENERLRAELDNQRGAEIEYRAGILEYQELLRLNQLLGTSSYPSQTAQVQGASPTNFGYTVEIDKGSVSGIAVGMPVVNGGGLVGKITQVRPNSSVVLLIVDPEFSIGAKVLSEAPVEPTITVPQVDSPTSGTLPAPGDTTTTPPTATTAPGPTTTADRVQGPLDPIDDPVGLTTTTLPPDTESTGVPLFTTTTTTPLEVIRETGSLSGQGAGEPLVLRFVDDSSTQGRVRVGSTVQTAGGTESIAPAGIPIGEIVAIEQQSGSRAQLVQVEPSAGDLSKLNFVRVLLYVPNPSGS
ncbi:MAG: rod shape-determining protein MreC [Acidimicrobiales bacterium]|nr:rod shape-determining protein MreC [Acidimicrobiales bacterium]MCB9394279.1 rod shape-determining protein MreC [Acidimicrobiaceae bacterium]